MHFVTNVPLYVKLIIVIDENDTQYILWNKSAKMYLNAFN